MTAYAIKLNSKILPAWTHNHKKYLKDGVQEFKELGYKKVTIVKVKIIEMRKN